MTWQDIVLSVGALIFTIALIPSITGPHKPAFTTSILSSLILFVFTAVYLSLDLWISAILTSINAFAWLILAIQKSMAKK